MTGNHTQMATLAFMIAVTAIVIVFDIYMFYTRGSDATISRVTRHLAGGHPIVFVVIIFWLGVLIGHLGFPSEP